MIATSLSLHTLHIGCLQKDILQVLDWSEAPSRSCLLTVGPVAYPEPPRVTTKDRLIILLGHIRLKCHLLPTM